MLDGYHAGIYTIPTIRQEQAMENIKTAAAIVFILAAYVVSAMLDQ